MLYYDDDDDDNGFMNIHINLTFASYLVIVYVILAN